MEYGLVYVKYTYTLLPLINRYIPVSKKSSQVSHNTLEVQHTPLRSEELGEKASSIFYQRELFLSMMTFQF